MNKTLTLSIIGLLVAFPLAGPRASRSAAPRRGWALALVLILSTTAAGCIENIDDLKDRLGASETAVVEEPEPVKQAATTDNKTAPVDTTPPKAPVARISVFGEGGALIYKASFEANDETSPIYVSAPVTLELLASDSEVLEPGAELTNYTWDFAGMKMEGRKVSHVLADAGSYPLTLTIEDSAGGKDTQSLSIVVAPKPFTVETHLVTDPVAGVAGEGQGGTTTFTVASLINGKQHDIQSLVFTTQGAATPEQLSDAPVDAGPSACDTILEIVKPDGESTGAQDTGNQETITFGTSAEGAYIINVTGFTCAAPLGVKILVTATFLEIVEGVAAGDGHGHNH